jgi:hypothetical protein
MNKLEIYDSSVLQYACNKVSPCLTVHINANVVSFSHTKRHAHYLSLVEDNVRHVVVIQDLEDIILRYGQMQ